MKLLICVFVVIIPFSAIAQQDQLSPQLGEIFSKLWQDSAFGEDPNRTERAAWILGGDSDDYRSLTWPSSSERNREYWRGPVPKTTLAQAHTHTVAADPKPSAKDMALSKQIGIPIYTISGSGIWMVTPQSKVVRIARAYWYKQFSGRPHSMIANAGVIRSNFGTNCSR